MMRGYQKLKTDLIHGIGRILPSFYFYLIDSVSMSFANPSIAFVLPLEMFFNEYKSLSS